MKCAQIVAVAAQVSVEGGATSYASVLELEA
jgi:hypothetical protein